MRSITLSLTHRALLITLAAFVPINISFVLFQLIFIKLVLDQLTTSLNIVMTLLQPLFGMISDSVIADTYVDVDRF